MTDTKPRTEVTEEVRETLSVMELDRTPRPEKLQRERAYFDGAHEVRFTERTFRPRHAADLDEIRSFVDSLVVQKREVPPLPAPPEPAKVTVPAKIPEHYREPLERVVPGALVSVETVHRVGTGTVVDVSWEGADEGERRGLFVIEEGAARPYTDVATRIDELPAPATPAAPAPEPAPPAAAEPASEPAAPAEAPTKRRLLGFGRKKDKTEPAHEPEPADEPAKKRRFGFGRK